MNAQLTLSRVAAMAACFVFSACSSSDASSDSTPAPGNDAVDGGSSADGSAKADASAASDSSQTADGGGTTGDAVGTAADTAKPANKSIEVAGTWADPFGTTETITATDWNAKGSGFESKSSVVEHDNKDNWAITQSSADDPYSANKFSKRVWTEPKDGAFHYCSVVFGQETADLAKATTLTADDGDLDGKGCGGFPWSKLTAKK